MFWFLHQLTDHGLDDTDVAIQQTTQGSTDEGNPEVGGESYHDHAEHGSDATHNQNRLSTDPIRQTTPVHAHGSLGKREGRNKEAGVEGRIFFISYLELLDEGPGIGKDGS